MAQARGETPTQIQTVEDLARDVAGTHRFTGGDHDPGVDAETFEAEHAALLRDGYVMLRNLIDAETVTAVRAGVTPLLGQTGRNIFEGERTQRIYAVLEKTRAVDRLVDHPRVLAHLNRIFQPNYLLSQLQVINILPGETAQLEHADDSFYGWPRPRPPLGAATIWAIDAFTEDNGATVALPGSHTWAQDRPPTPQDARIKAVMEPGSCILFLGTLWHGGGANLTDAPRLAVTAQYCEPWLRTQENYSLAVCKDVAAAVSEDIRRMLGYSVHPPFIGMVNGMHPKRVLPDA